MRQTELLVAGPSMQGIELITALDDERKNRVSTNTSLPLKAHLDPICSERRDIAFGCVDEVERFDSLLPESRPVGNPSRFSKAAMGQESLA